MATRRQFLQGSLATSGLVLASSAFAGPGVASVLGPPGARLKLQGVVFEPGRTQSAAFAAAARQRLPTFGIDGDITPVWARLVELWRTAPAAIAGMTTHTPLLLLEQSARDYGLRVAFRAEHRPMGDGTVAHSLSGPPDVIGAFGLAARRERNFGACVARAVVHCPAVPGASDTRSLQTPAHGHAAEGPLYSWVLAPRKAHPRGANA
ncbi:hypothetical protein ACW7G0_08210 [Lysobacter sp. A286]